MTKKNKNTINGSMQKKLYRHMYKITQRNWYLRQLNKIKLQQKIEKNPNKYKI